MALSEIAIRKAKARDKLIKLSDAGGLQLWITPDGAKRWRLAYRFGGGQKLLAIGVYPVTSLKDARQARDDAKRLLAQGQDPSRVKKLAKAAKVAASANTFDTIGGELLDKKRKEAKADHTLSKLEWLLSLASPAIGARPIAEITAPEILAVLRTVESRGRRETARRLRATIGAVFRYAVATGRAHSDPTSALKGALASPIIHHHAAIIELKAFGGLLRAIATYDGAPETRAALELLALTFVRPGELRAAEWADFDLEASVWSIPSRQNEDAPAASGPPGTKSLCHLVRAAGPDGNWQVPFPVRSLASAVHERKHDQRGLAPTRFYQR